MDRYETIGEALETSQDGRVLVYQGTDKDSDFPVIIKHYFVTEAIAQSFPEKYQRFQTLAQEIEGIESVSNTFQTPDQYGTWITLIEESGKSVDQLYKEGSSRPDDIQLWELMKVLCSVLSQVHSQNWVHGGISTSSIYYTTEGKWKIGDFLDVRLKEEMGIKPDLTGFCSPERRNELAEFDYFKADWYSLGMVFLYLINAQVRDWSSDPDTLEQEINAEIQHLSIIDEVLKILKLFLSPFPNLRPASRDVIPFIKALEGCEEIDPESSLEDSEDDAYICSFCLQITGTINESGDYECRNQDCPSRVSPEVDSVPIALDEEEPPLEAIRENELNPVDPKVVEIISAEKPNIEMPRLLRPCTMCTNGYDPSSDTSPWKEHVRSLPKSKLADICSLACYEKYCGLTKEKNETLRLCMCCFEPIPRGQQTSVYVLPCDPHHLFCKLKCWNQFKLESQPPECPRCKSFVDFNAVQPPYSKDPSEMCQRCLVRDGIEHFRCGHRACTRCTAVVTDDSIGHRMCPIRNCGRSEPVN